MTDHLKDRTHPVFITKHGESCLSRGCLLHACQLIRARVNLDVFTYQVKKAMYLKDSDQIASAVADVEYWQSELTRLGSDPKARGGKR
jgi:hypothetical protein